jgi:hypothetical protein
MTAAETKDLHEQLRMAILSAPPMPYTRAGQETMRTLVEHKANELAGYQRFVAVLREPQKPMTLDDWAFQEHQKRSGIGWPIDLQELPHAAGEWELSHEERGS